MRVNGNVIAAIEDRPLGNGVLASVIEVTVVVEVDPHVEIRNRGCHVSSIEGHEISGPGGKNRGADKAIFIRAICCGGGVGRYRDFSIHSGAELQDRADNAISVGRLSAAAVPVAKIISNGVGTETKVDGHVTIRIQRIVKGVVGARLLVRRTTAGSGLCAHVQSKHG